MRKKNNDDYSPKLKVFINYYLADKEFFVPDKVRDALDYIQKLIKNKNMDKSLAIHTANNWYYKKYGIEYGKDFLRNKYNMRMAYIKNAIDKYHEWCVQKREEAAGIKTFCSCGCGQEIKKGNKFINGHNSRCRSKEENNRIAVNLRKIKEEKNKPKTKIINLQNLQKHKNL